MRQIGDRMPFKMARFTAEKGLLFMCAIITGLQVAKSVSIFNTTYPDGTVLHAELISFDGSIVRTVIVPPGSNESFLRYPLTVSQPPLPANASFDVTEFPTFFLLATETCTLNVSKRDPVTQLLSPDGSLLSGEAQPVSREPASQCGEGHGGPITPGCLRAWRTLQYGESIFGFGMQSFSVDQTGKTVWIATDGNFVLIRAFWLFHVHSSPFCAPFCFFMQRTLVQPELAMHLRPSFSPQWATVLL